MNLFSSRPASPSIRIFCSVPLILAALGCLETSARAQAPAAPVPVPVNPPLQATGFLLKPTDVLAICGDSITEQKRYSCLMEDYLLACQPGGVKGEQAYQAGWSGETAPGFFVRMNKSVLPLGPTAATTCYGMNDGHYVATTPDIVNVYRAAMVNIVEDLKKKGVTTIVVGTPGAVDTTSYNNGNRAVPADVYNVALGALGDAAKSVAGQEGVYFADVHSVMLDVMGKAKAKFGDKYQVAGPDGVHPGLNGHLIMAYAYLKALGCDGDLGTITYDMTADTAQAVGGHTVDSCQKGELHVTSTRYPFCFTGNPGDSNSDRDIVQFFPFNQDLNRLTLVVHHATAPQVKVTWGSESHVYTADQLEAGINLAADFVNNPFVPAFTKLDTLVYQQQQSDTNVTKVYYGAFNQMELDMPDQTADIETLRGHIIDHEKQVIATTSAPVPPVSHVITIVAATAADLAAPTAAPAAPAPAPAG